MKTILPLLLLSVTLGFAEPAPPGGASSPSEPQHHAEIAEAKPHAESAEPDPSRAAEPRVRNPARRGGCGAPRPPLRAEVSLVDGSILKGTLRQHALPARSPNLGDICVRLGKVESIAFGKFGALAKIAFKNGDTLSARFPADRAFVTMDTVVGRVRVPFDKVASLVLEPSTSSPLLYHCTFDSVSSIEHPAAGPAGTFLRGEFVPGKVGGALRVEADTPAFESKLPKGFLGPEGCLEFWAKIEGDDPRYVDGGDPLFVSFYNERGAITLLQFAANNGFARGGLGGAFASWPFGTIPHYAWSMEYRKVLGDDWSDWHHYAMSWKAGGFGDGSFVKVFVDGRPQPVLGGVDDDKLPARLADYANHAHDLGIPWSAARAADHRRSKKPFLVDDLRIWSVPKTDFGIVARPVRSYRPELLYHCTFDSPESVERPAAGPAGQFLGGEFVPGKVGNALFVKAGTHAAEVPFPTGLMQPEGCIEFWAKIPGATKETCYPDGGNPTFFAMKVGKWVNTFVKYTANDGFGTGGLHADLPGSAYISSRPSWSESATYPDFLGDPAAWHHYALVWSEKGLDAASEALGRRVVSALYVDGRLVNPAYGTNDPDRAKFLREFVVNSVVLAFPIVPGCQDFAQNRVDYLIDDFKIWNFPKTDFAIAVPSVEPRLLYHCTFDSAGAVEHPAAGPNGRFLGGEFVPGKKGSALCIPGNVPIALVDLPRGFLEPKGTIEFWSKIEDPPASYGDRGNPRFFGLSLFDDPANPGPCSTYLQFTSNDGMGMSGLCGMIYHRAMATDPTLRTHTYGPILEDPAAWHHYAIVWDADGLPFSKASDGTPAVAAIVLDGRVLQTFGRNQFAHGKGLLRLPELQGKLAFPVSDTNWGFFPRPVAFLIDEFKIWSAPKTQFGER